MTKKRKKQAANHPPMSLVNFQLPPIVIQNLFSNSLVELNNIQEQSTIPSDNTISWLGNNEKRVLIIIYNKESLYLPDPLLEFLLGVLTACKLTLGDVAVVNIHKTGPISYQELGRHLKIDKVILFGIGLDAIELPLKFPDYQLQKYNDMIFLSVPTLDILLNNKEEKTRLWTCLQKMFNLTK